MWKVFAWALTWLVKGAVIKSVVLAAVFAVVVFLVPFVVTFLGNLISPGALTGAFSQIPAGVWYFLDAFQISYGAPLVISAFVASFLIRRLPVIG